MVGKGKKVLIVCSASGSLIYNGDESVRVKGIFWFLGLYESSG